MPTVLTTFKGDPTELLSSMDRVIKKFDTLEKKGSQAFSKVNKAGKQASPKELLSSLDRLNKKFDMVGKRGRGGLEQVSKQLKKTSSDINSLAADTSKLNKRFDEAGEKGGQGFSKTNKASKEASKGLLGFIRAAKGVDDSISSLSSTSLLAGVTIGTLVKSIVNFGAASVEAFGSTQRLETANNSLAKSIGLVGSGLTESIINTSGGTIDAITAMESANKAMSFGIIKTNKDMEDFTRAAKILGPALGQSVAKSLDDLTIGFGRQSKEILDNVGIQVTASVAQEKYAKKLGVSTKSLDDNQRAIAFREEALRSMNALVESIGESETGLTDRTETTTAALVNFKISIGSLLEQPVSSFLDSAAESLVSLTEGANAWNDVINNLAPAVVDIASGGQPEQVSENLLSLAKERLQEQKAILDFTDKENAAAIALTQARIEGIQAEITGLQVKQQAVADTKTLVSSEVALEKQSRNRLVQERRITAELLVQNNILASQEGKQFRLNDMLSAGGNEAQRRSDILNRTEGSALDQRISNENAIAQAATEAQEKRLTSSKQFHSKSVSLAQSAADKQAQALQGAVGQALGGIQNTGLDVESIIGPRDSLNEDVKRLAAVAMEGMTTESAAFIKRDNPELFAKLLGAGDGAQELAKQMFADFSDFGIGSSQLINEEMAVERVKKILLGQSDLATLKQKVLDRLSGEGGFALPDIEQAFAGAGFGGGLGGDTKGQGLEGEGEALPVPGMAESGMASFDVFQQAFLERAAENNMLLQLGGLLAEQAAAVDYGRVASEVYKGVTTAMTNSPEAAGARNALIEVVINEIIGRGLIKNPNKGR